MFEFTIIYIQIISMEDLLMRNVISSIKMGSHCCLPQDDAHFIILDIASKIDDSIDLQPILKKATFHFPSIWKNPTSNLVLLTALDS